MKKRNTYTREFKLEAVRYLETSNKSVSALSRKLGIRRSLFYKWKKEFCKLSNDPSSSKENQSSSMDETTRLKLELEQVKTENMILKRALAFVAKELE